MSGGLNVAPCATRLQAASENTRVTGLPPSNTKSPKDTHETAALWGYLVHKSAFAGSTSELLLQAPRTQSGPSPLLLSHSCETQGHGSGRGRVRKPCIPEGHKLPRKEERARASSLVRHGQADEVYSKRKCSERRAWEPANQPIRPWVKPQSPGAELCSSELRLASVASRLRAGSVWEWLREHRQDAYMQEKVQCDFTLCSPSQPGVLHQHDPWVGHRWCWGHGSCHHLFGGTHSFHLLLRKLESGKGCKGTENRAGSTEQHAPGAKVL